MSRGGGDRTKQPAEYRALRLVGNIVKEDGSFEHPDEVAVNKRVQAKIIDLGDGMGLPQWQLSEEAPDGEPWQITAPAPGRSPSYLTNPTPRPEQRGSRGPAAAASTALGSG